jgi:hypothetical protein
MGNSVPSARAESREIAHRAHGGTTLLESAHGPDVRRAPVRDELIDGLPIAVSALTLNSAAARRQIRSF